MLLDRGLPDATGDDILKSLRNKQKDTPVIFITAKDSIHDRVAGLDLGANDYLVKPFQSGRTFRSRSCPAQTKTANAKSYPAMAGS